MAPSHIAELLDAIHGTKVFIGCRAAAEDEALLETHNIIAIITVGANPPACTADVSMKLKLRLDDLSTGPLLGHLQKAFPFIEKALQSEENGAVLVTFEEEDGEAGATAVVLGWLMAHQQVPWSDAPDAIKADRPSALLNPNYEKQLKVWSKWKEFPGFPEWV
jgi:hypothetical protein